MDGTQEHIKFLGILGIFTHSFKTIFTMKKIFAQITFTLILPLTITLIAHMDISKRFFSKIEQNPYNLITDACNFYQSYNISFNQATSTEWLYYFLFKMITIFLIIILSLLSTCAIVYTIACVHANRDEVTYQKAMIKVVPKVCKRLVVTFLTMFLYFFAYTLLSSVVFFLWRVIFLEIFFAIGFLVLLVIYSLGFMYLAITWQLASVISVLESSHGLKSMIKAMDLMKGKKKVALTISFILYFFSMGIVFIYMVFFVFDGPKVVPIWKAMIGIMCFVLLVMVLLLTMVVQTVLYLVCKAHHREAIDPVSLTTYLGAYLSDSQPVFRVGEDIQLGRPQNRTMS